jgi:hypothetical protein
VPSKKWRRITWLLFFFFISFALIFGDVFVSKYRIRMKYCTQYWLNDEVCSKIRLSLWRSKVNICLTHTVHLKCKSGSWCENNIWNFDFLLKPSKLILPEYCTNNYFKWVLLLSKHIVLDSQWCLVPDNYVISPI